MGRHDIRLRRHRMTSRRIEGYKDYNSLMERHRSGRAKRLVKFFFLLLFFVALMFFIYYLMPTLTSDKSNEPAPQAQKISRPGVLNEFSLNTQLLWKSEKTRKRT